MIHEICFDWLDALSNNGTTVAPAASWDSQLETGRRNQTRATTPMTTPARIEYRNIHPAAAVRTPEAIHHRCRPSPIARTAHHSAPAESIAAIP